MLLAEKRVSRKDKEALLEFDIHVKDIRQQLNEQLKCLDVRVETQVALVSEIQDYFRRRAEVELEYSRNLEKLAKGLTARHKAEKQKREQWHLFSTYSCWQHLISSTKRQSKDHAALADIYANNMVNRCTHTVEDIQRIYKRCREIGNEGHEELLKVLHELHTAMKTYHDYQGELKQAESKLKIVEGQLTKLEQTVAKEKLEKSKKFRVIEKEIQKRQSKCNDSKLKALKARNEYLLCMDAANAAIRKYFVDDLSDLIDCMDFGFHNCIARAFMMYVSGEESLKRAKQVDIDNMNKCVASLDTRVDKQRFLEYNNAPFMIPKKFEFQGHRGDEENAVSVDKSIQDEMEHRFKLLCRRLTALKTESEEIWKTLETAEKSLMDMINTKDYDCTSYFGEDNRPRINGPRQPETITLKLRADRQETEDFYLNKFREYTMGSNLIARLQSKYEVMRKTLGNEVIMGKEGSQGPVHPRSHRNSFLSQKPKRKRIGRTPLVGQPRLFGGSLEEYLEVTNQEIPLIVKSCIRIINLYGLHHQGVFRVSGAQVEINCFKEAFERGEDPLADMTDASDINSVAGVLKLYLRELREPLFQIYYFEQFMDISKLESKHEFVSRVRDLIVSLPRAVYVVMRYLFAFLNHLSEFSDENMMDPYNLAICFGPTLLPIPEDKDQVQYQNLVNELIKNIIVYQEDIFPDDGGTVYEKYISSNIPDDNDVEEAPVEQLSEEESEVGFCQSEDESELLEAVAQFDFLARSQRELSFKKGDTLTLHSQVSNDWWRGSFDGHVGLIPDMYIMLKIRDEDKDRASSDENMKRRASSGSDSLPGASPKLLGVVPMFPSPFGSRGASGHGGIIEETAIDGDPDETDALLGVRLLPDKPTVTAMVAPAGSAVPVREAKGGSRSPSPRTVPRPSSQEINSTRAESIGADTDPSAEDADAGIAQSKELQQDLDKALAHVISSLEILEKKSKCSRGSDAPDLVMDLPLSSSNPSSPSACGKGRVAQSSEPSPSTLDSPTVSSPKMRPSPEGTMTAAETFALSNQCTMKKSALTRTSSGPDPGSSVLDAQTQTMQAVKRSMSTSTFTGKSPPPVAADDRGHLHLRSQSDTTKPEVKTSCVSVTSAGVSSFKSPPPPTAAKTKPPVMKKPSLPLAPGVMGQSPETGRKVPPALKGMRQTTC